MLSHLAALTARQEANREQPWSLNDSAKQFVTDAVQGLIGFELDILTLSGKRFLSQQRTEADRQSVVHHLEREASGMARDVAIMMAP